MERGNAGLAQSAERANIGRLRLLNRAKRQIDFFMTTRNLRHDESFTSEGESFTDMMIHSGCSLSNPRVAGSIPAAPTTPLNQPLSVANLGFCSGTYNTLLDPADERPCSRRAHQVCGDCDARLCDIHAEFCVEHNAFFCEGCFWLHKDEHHQEGM
jgi:hypothetical protein